MDLRAPTGKKWLPAPTAMMAFCQPWPCQISTHRPWACRQATKKQWAPALTEMTAFRQQWLWQTGAQPRESTHACSTPTRLVRRGKRHQWKSPKKLNNACKCKVLCNTNREGSAPDRRNTSKKRRNDHCFVEPKNALRKHALSSSCSHWRRCFCLRPLLLREPPRHHPPTIPPLPPFPLCRFLAISLSLSLSLSSLPSRTPCAPLPTHNGSPWAPCPQRHSYNSREHRPLAAHA